MTKTKILKAHGGYGKLPYRDGLEHWNWCTDEPVSVHGMVCDNAKCGCNRAFVGVDSAKSTTIAKIVEVTDSELENIKLRLRNCILLGWNKSEQIANVAEVTFNLLLEQLENFEVGLILTINKEEGSFHLSPFQVEEQQQYARNQELVN